MAIYNLGSINADHFYDVPHLPAPGETLPATGHRMGLGGKGANQSVAAAKMGARVVHIGAVGQDGAWAVAELTEAGVVTDHIATVDGPTAHAIINVDPGGENAIVIHSAANLGQTKDRLQAGLNGAGAGDFLLLQNETNLVPEAAEMARGLGMTVVYSAAPFDEDAVQAVLDHVDILVMNEVEARQLAEALGTSALELQVPTVLITKGERGAVLHDGGQETNVAAFRVKPVDTTGAGDTYLGAFIAGLDMGFDAKDAMRLAAAASAIQVTRPGTASAIPGRAEVDAFLDQAVT